jgi:hypothetical protein
MADVYPSDRANMPVEVEQLIEFCSQLPSGWRVQVGWPEIGQETPDVLWVSPSHQVAVASASGANVALLDTWTPERAATASDSLPFRRLDRAIRALARTPETVTRWLLLTRVRAAQLSALFTAALPAGVACRCLDTFSAEELAEEIERGQPAAEMEDKLRQWIGRPTVVQTTLTAAPVTRAAPVRFLDKYQEQWLRRYLAPPPDAPDTRLQPGGQLITGVAGCGKSLLLLYRACLEQRIRPELRILFVTHNRALTAELNRRSGVLAEQLGVGGVDVTGFYAWCWKWIHPRPAKIVSYDQQDRFVASVLPTGSTAATIRFYREEFAWISDEGIREEADYLGAHRRGRLRAVQPAERRRIWTAYTAYQRALEREGGNGSLVLDWPGVAWHAWSCAEKGACPSYDLILVDEAQFFSPVAVRVLMRTLRPDGRVVFAADPTQGFLQRRSPWTSAGLDFRGRATRLRRPYRSMRRILEYARSFYLDRVPEEDAAEVNLPMQEDLAQAEIGEAPELIEVTHVQDESRVAVEQITRLLEGGARAEEILVVHHAQGRLIVPRDTAWTAVEARAVRRDRGVRICTFDAGTGLEAPYVIVMGVRRLLEPEDDPTFEADRAQLILDNTRKLYMAFTRAGHRLMVLWSGPNCPAYLQPQPLERPANNKTIKKTST